ncbi:nucleotidyltransferase domain-containing protein [Candidatus Berkelbacteria bacterium]|nr:nucleotidyltransferase domain-containing protein [Candidatus Berkelbacteria bacterium]MBI2588127.1 nucleotidyltransferase domain-containing protein [Candidatus Berkelbacteria bacterium]MBI4029702.1 nucleotidyltransferase domain-containing protein [Candidatus Berkelbacteria bacterium]
MEKKLEKSYWRKARWVAWLLQIVPYIRLIGVNGSLTTNELKPASDIDFLIITKPGRIFTCRFLVTLLVHFTGQRRYGQKVAGRICLNRYQASSFLDIQPHNEYHAKVFSSLVPIFDADSVYQKYVVVNQWMKKFNFRFPARNFKLVNNFLLGSVRGAGEMILDVSIGDWLENKLRYYQKNRILRDARYQTAPPGKIRISDKELCFHPLKGGGLTKF